jgi:hypothetical protein
MSPNDQADGFYEHSPSWYKCNHIECLGAKECLYPLKPDEDSGKGRGEKRQPEDFDCVERAHMPLGYRLAHGFSILKGGSI